MSGRKMTSLICNDSTMHSIINELIMSKTSPFNIQFVCKNLITVDLAKKTCTVCIVFFTKAKHFKHTKQIMELCEKNER